MIFDLLIFDLKSKNQSYFEDRAEGFSMYLDMDKVRNYDKQKVIETLEKAANRLKDKVIV